MHLYQYQNNNSKEVKRLSKIKNKIIQKVKKARFAACLKPIANSLGFARHKFLGT
jgi:hypothetical protein